MISVPVAGLFTAFVVFYIVAFVGRRDKRLPPGPRTIPILGNLLQIPTKRTHLKFQTWAKEYGGIFSLKIGPGTAIIISSPELVRKLVDKKSALYSHRPPSYIGNSIIGGGDHLLLMQYNDQLRTCRKLIHQYFMEKLVMKHHLKLVDAEAIQMVRDFMIEPEGYMKHPKRFSNSIIMSLVYGIRTPTIETVHMKKLYRLMEDWSEVMETGNTPPVDVFPFLKWIPEQLLGMWRSRARSVSNQMNGVYNDWYQHVIDRRKVSGSCDCFLDRVLNQEDKIDFTRHATYFLCGGMIEGGSDTSSSAIIACIHAMTKYPKVLRQAQAQIDAVVGETRSPTWDDYINLPYIAACVKETMRWRPVVPLAFPHSLAEDDELDGMHLPKGSDVFINAFGIHHDSRRFPDPDTFDPMHYEGVTALASELANASDPNKRDHYSYGAGRRLCPGIHLAERNLFLGIAKILWALDILPGLDDKGQIIEPDTSNERAYSHGFVVCAERFPCRIAPRSEARKATILREFEAARIGVFSQYETPVA